MQIDGTAAYCKTLNSSGPISQSGAKKETGGHFWHDRANQKDTVTPKP